VRRAGFVVLSGLLAVGAVFAESVVVEQVDMVVSADVLHSGRVVGQDASVSVTLAGTPGIQVNSQGVPGGQSDLSIRGSSFSGAGLSLNGLSLGNAQTEHFNAELPIISAVLSAPTVLSGIDQTVSTEGHLVGTASFSVMPIDTGRSLTLGAAEDNGYWVSALLQERLLFAGGDGFTGLGAFGAYTEINAVDYSDNDVRSKRGGAQYQVVRGDSQWDLLVAHQEKRFGARGYYGVTPAWKAEEETEDTMILGSWVRGDTDQAFLRSSLLRREQTDDYTLFWSLPGVYNNAHRTVLHAGVVDGRAFLGRHGVLDWRMHGQEERIRSSALGNHERTRGGITVIPGLSCGLWHIKAGIRQEVFEDDDSETLPQGSVEVALSDHLGLRLSHSQSVRQPSYTELNYESPASLGNAGLENQTAKTTELAVTGDVAGLQWRLALFQRETDDAVDWIRETESSTRWAAQNLGEVDTEGVDLGVSFRASDGSRLAAQYMYLKKETDAEVYSSRYALDYPEHYVLLSGLWQITERMGVELTQAFRQQDANPLRGSSDAGYDGTLAIHVVPMVHPQAQITLMVNNVWDDDYEVFPGQSTVSPRRVSAGVTIDW
jgi:vitamin B12 transporter